MAVFKVDIGFSGMADYTRKLGELNKSGIPLAIRGTLNGLAFEVKKTSLPRIAQSTFEQRQANFFKANSRVEMAKGFSVKDMVSEVGMVNSGLHNQSTNYAVKDLEQQEKGGTINSKTFIPLKNARTGNDFKRTVKPNARLSAIRQKTIIDSRNAPNSANSKQAFRKSIIFAGKGGFVIGNKNPRILWEVLSLNKTATGQPKLAPLYSVESGRSVRVHQTKFMERSAKMAYGHVQAIYYTNAERQMKRVLK